MICDRCGQPITGEHTEIVPPSERAARPTVYLHKPACLPPAPTDAR